MIALTWWFDIDPLRFEDQAADSAAKTLRSGASANRAMQDKRLAHSQGASVLKTNRDVGLVGPVHHGGDAEAVVYHFVFTDILYQTRQ